MALLQHARDYATDALQWAVSEGQRCFQAPLDHTRHGPVEPLPEMVNQPTGNPYFDRMLKSDTGLKFLELQDSLNNVKKSKASPEVSAKASPEASPEGNRSPFKVLSPCLTVVIVDEEGNRNSHKLKLNPSDFENNEAKEDSSSLDDSLSKRSQPGAVKHAVQSLMDQCQCKEATEEVPAALVEHQSDAANKASERTSERDCDSQPKSSKKNLTNILSGIPVSPDVKAKPNESQQDSTEERNSWQVGSVLEVFSASNDRWFPALVTQVAQTKSLKEMLTVQFWLNIEDAKQKTMARDSELLAKLGMHCAEQLPPGFQVAASSSRPGMQVFLDATTGLKYESLELIWAVHFKRWLEHPTPAGMQTISSVQPAVVSTVNAALEWCADGEDMGLVTRVAPEASLERDEHTLLETGTSSKASAMYLDTGFEDLTYGDLDAWVMWSDEANRLARAKEAAELNSDMDNVKEPGQTSSDADQEAVELAPDTAVAEERADLSSGADEEMLQDCASHELTGLHDMDSLAADVELFRQQRQSQESVDLKLDLNLITAIAHQSSTAADEEAKGLGMKLVTSQWTTDSCNVDEEAYQNELSARVPTSSEAMEKRLLSTSM